MLATILCLDLSVLRSTAVATAFPITITLEYPTMYCQAHCVCLVQMRDPVPVMFSAETMVSLTKMAAAFVYAASM